MPTTDAQRMLQWSHDLSVVECPGTSPAGSTPPFWLQWSHDLSVVECCHRGLDRADVTGASMEPRPLGRGMSSCASAANAGANRLQWSHDLSVVEWECSSNLWRMFDKRLRFNGATTSRSWNADAPRPARRRGLCFNGATTSRSWNVRHVAAPEVRDRLQWSHDLSVVECGSRSAKDSS